MADQLTPASAFHDWHPLATPGLTVTPRETLTLASFAAIQGKENALREAIYTGYGVELPRGTSRVTGVGTAFVWAGPDHWLALAEREGGRDLESELKEQLSGIASVVDQSDGRVVVRIAGPHARSVLAKGVPLDLHPRAFRPGDVAITHASHIGVILWQVDDQPTYEVALFRSYADSFAHWLFESAAEYAAPAT
ncbi:sarcosine oxidase subunit gamma family protein [Hyphomicrobium sp. CS1GBMeth3]|uniref:sarcosine oxidase subunit gamma n=1 Tax=Hyphomicrobium sp. CS1GBMeth3 TaxID=1892845 RepID=UPI0009300E66|nr:sarcosine oxidase subunit gamma family protein [Hyphomicrobium sp. CS1GBMeth3]